MADQNNAPERIWLTDSEAELFGCYDRDFNGEGHVSYTLADRAAPEGQPVTLTYTNWRGETAERTITPKRIWFGSTYWHPEPQWLLTAFDAEKQADRDFALRDFGQVPPPAAPTDNTALVDGLRPVAVFLSQMEELDLRDAVLSVIAALASREAPPAAQEPVVTEMTLEQRRDWIANGPHRVWLQEGHTWFIEPVGKSVRYTRDDLGAPPPACQQEAVTVAEAAQKVTNLWDNGCHDISWRGHFDEAMTNLKAALRALKGGSDNG